MKKYKDKKQYRYRGYDYSQDGFYFVTICAKNREMFFGDIVNGKMVLSKIGLIADEFWQEIPRHFPFVKLDEYIVMPNHVHGIIVIENNTQTVGTQDFAFLKSEQKNCNNAGTQDFAFQPEYQNKFGPQSKNLSSIVRGFKIEVTKYAKNNNLEFAWPARLDARHSGGQSRFHDRIIRNENELNKIRQYIIDNPIKWELDRNNLENLYM